MDWSVAQGISGLYTDVNKKQSAKDELGYLNNLKRMQKEDIAEKEQAQLKEQAYYEQVSKFSDSLLSPDRDKINLKAKELSKKVREHVRLYGGDMTKFFANGGHKVLSKYKNDLVNSEESSSYIENKKNMDRIIDIQRGPYKHLLNKNDLANLKEYQKNGSGKITYTGLLNDIEMPSDKNYDFGEKIPAEDILNNKSNRMKIYGNFKTTYPDLELEGEDLELALKSYVVQNYQGVGSNYLRKQNADKERNRHLEALAQTKAGITKEKIKAIAKSKTSSNKKGSGGGKGSSDNSNIKMFDTKYSNTYAGNVTRTMALAKDITVADFGQKDYWNGKQLVNNVSNNEYKESANMFSVDNNTWYDINRDTIGRKWLKGTWLESYFSKDYAPANALHIYEGHENKLAQGILLGGDESKIDLVTGTISGWQPDKNSFFPNGDKLGDEEDEVDYDNYKGTYKIKGIITAGTVKGDNNGREETSMIMNLMDDGVIDTDATEKAYSQVATNKVHQGKYFVLEMEDGEVFYHPIANGALSEATINELLPENDISGVVKDQAIRKQEEKAASQWVKDHEDDVNSFWDLIGDDVSKTKGIYHELTQIHKGGYKTERSKLLKSWYGHLIMNTPNEDKVSKFKGAIDNQSFLKAMKEFTPPKGYSDIAEYIDDSDIKDLDIIEYLRKQDVEVNGNPLNEQYNQWINNFKLLERR